MWPAMCSSSLHIFCVILINASVANLKQESTTRKFVASHFSEHLTSILYSPVGTTQGGSRGAPHLCSKVHLELPNLQHVCPNSLQILSEGFCEMYFRWTV